MKTMVGDREGKLCAEDGERRKNIDCLENADLKDVWGLRKMRQGNSCRHLVLSYPRWEVEELLLFYILNCCRVTVPACCLHLCLWESDLEMQSLALQQRIWEAGGICWDLVLWDSWVTGPCPEGTECPHCGTLPYSFLLLPGFKV